MAATVRIRTEAGEEALDLEEFEGRISRGEVAPHCPVYFPTPEGARWVKASDLELFRALFHPERHTFARRFRLARIPWLTLGLIAINFAVFLLMRAEGPIDTDAMVRWGAKVLPLVGDLGETWRLISANFIHRDWIHIGFNVFMIFNVGGALENAYRPLDYLALLLASALGCTLTSLAFAGDAISIGASGIAFGCLGGAVVFGLRYREILPKRYRQLLGEAAIPFFLVFLYIGWTSPGVDNWGHLGGLLFGAATAGLLPARLLLSRRTSWGSSVARAIPLVGVLLLLTFGGRVLAPALPPLSPVRDDEFGISVQVPQTWRRGVERLAPLAFHNALPGLGRAVFAATPKLLGPDVPLQADVDGFVRDDLKALESRGEISELTLEPLVPAQVAGRDALLLRARYESDESGATRVRAYFVPRGSTVYELVFRLPEAYPGYERVADAMLDAVRFTEPSALRRARARVLLAPEAPLALAVLGDTLGELGEPLEASRMLQRAEPLQPGDRSIPARLGRELIEAGQLDQGCAAAGRAAATDLKPDDTKDSPWTTPDAAHAAWGNAALEVLLAQFDCARARGDVTSAKQLLQVAQALAPHDAEVARALATLH